MGKLTKKVTKTIYKLLPDNLKHVYNSLANKVVLSAWEKNGKPFPPPHQIKQKLILEYKNRYNCDILIESGTFMGDMIFAQIKNFKQLYTIELSAELWEKAKVRFRKYPHVTLLQGDSGVVLHDVVPKLNSPGIFWLDGHYSAGPTAKGNLDCPIYEELKAVFKSNINHVLLIDDARLFNGSNDYPTTKELSDFILQNRPNSEVEIKDDVIIAVLK